MIPPIPRYLLPHTATLMKPVSRDKWGKETNDIFTLRYVRFEPVDTKRYSLDGDLSDAKARLFVDAVNSDTEGAVIETGDRIVFYSREYRVLRVSDMYEKQSLHHREVMLA